MSHHTKIIRRHRYVAGYGFIDDIVRYGKRGIEYLKPKLINGVRHLVPIIQSQLPKLEELANKGLEKGAETVKNFALDKAKELTNKGAKEIAHQLDRVNPEEGNGVVSKKQKQGNIRNKKLLAIIERSLV
jgi:hypothetical protein